MTALFSSGRNGSGAKPAGSKGLRGSGRRLLLTGALALLATASALLAGGWGLLAALSVEALPARPGEAVSTPGGAFKVDAVIPEHMAPMQMDKFAASGMSMSGMVPDMTPENRRRFIVEVALAADERGSGLRYSAKDFRLTGSGMGERAPLRDKLGTGTVPAGSAISGTLVFQVPEEARNLRLSFDGGRVVALDLPPASHGHSGGGHTGGDHARGEQRDHGHHGGQHGHKH